MRRSALVVLDYDRTLTPPFDSHIEPAVVSALLQLRRDANVVVATARSIGSLRSVCHWRVYFDYAIASSGAVVYSSDSRAPQHVEPVSLDIELLAESGVPFAVERDSCLFATEAYNYDGEGESLPIGSIESNGFIECERLYIKGELNDARSLVRRISATRLREVALPVEGVRLFQARLATKHHQAEVVRSALGVCPADTLAAGDDQEDLGLLNWARIPFWMGERSRAVGRAMRPADACELLELLSNSVAR